MVEIIPISVRQEVRGVQPVTGVSREFSLKQEKEGFSQEETNGEGTQKMLSALDEIYLQLSKELKNQESKVCDSRTDWRALLAASGQCTGIEKAMRFVSLKRKELTEKEDDSWYQQILK
jgi:hypothetical protein